VTPNADLKICHPERSQAKSEAIGLAESKDPYSLTALCPHPGISIAKLKWHVWRGRPRPRADTAMDLKIRKSPEEKTVELQVSKGAKRDPGKNIRASLSGASVILFHK
jgi:hypothetical protein